jgi:hypothetical protein
MNMILQVSGRRMHSGIQSILHLRPLASKSILPLYLQNIEALSLAILNKLDGSFK